jgi:hypothetical protein
MPRYTVSLNRTLTLIASVSLRAKNEEEVRRNVQEMIEEGNFGSIEWAMTSRKTDWEEEEDDITITGIEGE